MSDDALIRLENLRRLVKERGYTVYDLAEKTGKWHTYWRDMLKGGKKSFGEKAARNLEQALGLPRMWLDQVEAPVPPVAGSQAEAEQNHAAGALELIAQLLMDILATPLPLRMLAINAAINAVADIAYGTSALEKATGAPADGDETAPSEARLRSRGKKPAGSPAPKPGKTSLG